MRRARWTIACLAAFFCAGALPAQEANVAVGSVIKNTDLVAGQSDRGEAKSTQSFLDELEAHIAKAFLEHPEVDYMDRMNTGALFDELHLSSDAAFNSDSGALRGLLRRLDYLVVIDASTPTSARVRLIDLETGAVKAIETCVGRGGDQATPACVGPFVNRAVAVANAKLKIRVQAQDQAAADAAAGAQRQAETNRQLEEAKPDLDDLSALVRSQLGFWQTISAQLAATGQPLRGSTQVLLDRARADDRDCHSYFEGRDVESLHTCMGKLRTDVDDLEALRKQIQQ
jgi:hypothetical protein